MLLQFFSMSLLHLTMAVLIGLVVGGILGLMYETMNLKKSAFVLRFMLLGVMGSFAFDIFFSFMTANHFLPGFFYIRPTIVVEDVVGAALVPYLTYRPFIEYKPPRLKKQG